MSKRVFAAALAVILLTPIHVGQAQQAKKVPLMGFLLALPRSAVAKPLEAFRQGMRDRGYVEGQNIVTEHRYAEGKFDRLPDLAAELVRRKVDVIVAAGGVPAILAAKNATKTIPIVFTASTDPVASGFIASLARPGGNITGLSLGGNELYGKRLEILKETVPRVSRVAFFWYETSSSAPDALSEMYAAAQALRLQIQSLQFRSPNDFEAIFKATVKGGARALTVTTHPIFTANRSRILDFAVKNRLPAMYPWREYADDGGLMSYAPNLSDLYRRAATYVDKILKEEWKAADLPVEQPMKFEFIVNLNGAKQIGFTVPPNVLVRANEVIK